MNIENIIIIILVITICYYLYKLNNKKIDHFTNNVPKVIYLCYKTKDIPEVVMDTWKKLNPDYEVKLYDNKDCINFLLDNYGQKFVDIFNYIKDGPIKADFWRICILNKYGGVYADVDIKPLLPIKEFVEPNAYFVTCGSIDKTKPNPHFIYCNQNNLILKKCIDIYEKKFDNKDKFEYWDWSITHIMKGILNDKIGEIKNESYIKRDDNGNLYQIIEEKNADSLNNIYCVYNNKKVLHNRWENYDPYTHNFK